MEPLTTSTSSPASGATAAAPRAALNTDFQMFLQMLTTQMQNQDPLNPLDSAEYAQQLAAFSTVEQQTRTNTLLTDLASQFTLMGMSQLAGWVGQQARAEAPVWYDGAPVTLAPNPARLADRVVLVARDEAGQVVAREDLPLSTDPYQWLGASITGDPLPQGRYTLSLENYSGDQLLGESPVEAYATILEARGGPSGTTLILSGGVEVPATAITALRRPTGQ